MCSNVFNKLRTVSLGGYLLNVMTERVRFWETVYHLVKKEGMRLIQMNENEDIVWLEDERKEPYHIIRMARKNYDWANHLKHDVDRISRSANALRRELKLRQANITNVIFSKYTPIDDYSSLVSQPLPLTGGGKKQFRTIILSLPDLEEQFFPLATEWQLNETPQYMPEPQVEFEEVENELIRALQLQVKQSMQERQRKDQELFTYGRPRFTGFLIGIILAVFLMIEMQADTESPLTLIEYGAKFNPLIIEGEWWRFFSAMFLHIGLLHLMMNSLALFYLGGAVERIFGTKRFIFIYFLAGFTGSVASFVFNDNISAGASGAIFGCFGALLYFGLIYKRLFFRTMGMSLIVILAINLVFGFVVPMVDNGAHVGGLLGGFAAALITGLPKHKDRIYQRTAMIATAGMLLVLLWAGYDQEMDTTQLSSIYFQVGADWVEREDEEAARPYFRWVVDQNEEEVPEEIYTNALFMLAYVEIQFDRLDEAEFYLEETIEREEDFHEAFYNLALILHEQGRDDEAVTYIEEALEHEPDNSDYQELQQEIEQ